MISFVITNLNGYNELWFTIQSVLSYCETLDYEIIIADNGSDKGELDRVEIMVNNFAKYYPIRLIVYDRIKSCPGIRMAGIKEAKGDLICFMDGHVIMAHNYLETVLPLFKDPDVYVVCVPEKFFGQKLYEYTTGHQLAFEQSTTTWEPVFEEAYPIASACYAMTTIRKEIRDLYFEDEELNYVPYSTDEPYISLLPWMFGKKTLMQPKTYFAHRPWAYTRGGNVGYEQWRPLGAYALAGMEGYQKSMDFWHSNYKLNLPKKHREFIEKNAKVKFGDLGDYLTAQGVQR